GATCETTVPATFRAVISPWGGPPSTWLGGATRGPPIRRDSLRWRLAIEIDFDADRPLFGRRSPVRKGRPQGCRLSARIGPRPSSRSPRLRGERPELGGVCDGGGPLWSPSGGDSAPRWSTRIRR